MLIGAGATAGVAVAQERSVGAAVDDAAIGLKINEACFAMSTSKFWKDACC
jgi:hypothetical protein